MLFLVDKLDFPIDVLRSLCAWLCTIIYPLIAKLFQLFLDIATLRLQLPVDAIFKRVTMMLTIIMVFYIIFEFIKYIVQPDNMTDKEKGVGKLGYKIVMVIVLLAFVPNIFTLAWKLQNIIIQNETISKIIIGRASINGTKAGNSFAAVMFKTFYKYNDDFWDDSDEGNKICVKDGKVECKRIVNWNIDKLALNGEFPNLNFGLNAAEKDPSTDTGSKIALIDYNAGLSVFVGIFVLYILVLYTIDVAKRLFQLAYLEIIAPIPIIGYLSPKKDNIFSKWVKQCITTYIDVFIRLTLIYFVLFISQIISESIQGGNGLLGVTKEETGDLIYIILIMGLLLFAQKAPKLIEELFPKMGSAAASGNFGLKAGERVAPLAARAIGASYGGLRRLAGGAIARGMNAHRRNKLEYERTGKTAKQRREEAKTAKGALKQTSQEYKMARNQRNIAAKQYGINSEQYKKAQKAFEKSRDALNEKQSTYADAMNSRRQSVLGNALAGGAGGALRGARAGFGATKLEDIGKRAQEAATADKKAIAAREQWLNSGGYSAAGRMASGFEQRMGIATDAQRRERDIKVEEAKIKANETLISRQSDVKSKQDSAKDRSGSKLIAGEQKTTVTAGTVFKYKDLNGNDVEVRDKTGTTSSIYAEYAQAEEQAKSASDAATKVVEEMENEKIKLEAEGGTWTNDQQKALDEAKTRANDKAKAFQIASDAKGKMKKQLEEYAITRILKDPDNAENDGVLKQKVQDTLTSIAETTRDSETTSRMKKILPDDLYQKYINGEITTFKEMDDVQVALINIANELGRENVAIKGTKARMESNSQLAADRANDSASNGGSK